MRLIDADDLIDKWNKLLSKMIPTADGAHPVDFGIIISEISKQPTIEAAPVVHGEWIDTQPEYHHGYGRNSHVCSNCRDYYTTEYDDLYFCPRCGAKMDGKAV